MPTDRLRLRPKIPPLLQLTDYQAITNNFILPPYSVATFRVPVTKGEQLFLETTTQVQSKKSKTWLGTLAGVWALDAARISSAENGKTLPRFSVTAMAVPAFLVRKPQPNVYLQVRKPGEAHERTANARRRSDRLDLSTEITASGEVEVSLVNEGNVPVVISNLKQTLTKPPTTTEANNESRGAEWIHWERIDTNPNKPDDVVMPSFPLAGKEFTGGDQSGGSRGGVAGGPGNQNAIKRYPISDKCAAIADMWAATLKENKEQSAVIVRNKTDGQLYIITLTSTYHKPCFCTFGSIYQDPATKAFLYGGNYTLVGLIHTHSGTCDEGPSPYDSNQLAGLHNASGETSIKSFVVTPVSIYEVIPKNPNAPDNGIYGTPKGTKNDATKGDGCKLPF